MLPFLKYIFLWFVDALPDISNVLLAVLGVIMSFPAKAEKIEQNPFWRKLIASLCIAVGLAGFGASSYQRRHFNSQITQLVADDDTLVKNTSGLVSNTNTMVTDFGVLMPTLTALQARVSELDAKIAEAREKHDPKLISDLQAQVASARQQADTISTKIQLSLAPGLIKELRDKYFNCYMYQGKLVDRYRFGTLEAGGLNAPATVKEQLKKNFDEGMANLNTGCTQDARPAMVTANYVRQELLKKMPPSNAPQEDEKYAAIFAKAAAGETIDYEQLRDSADYLARLTSEFAPSPPVGLPAATR